MKDVFESVFNCFGNYSVNNIAKAYGSEIGYSRRF